MTMVISTMNLISSLLRLSRRELTESESPCKEPHIIHEPVSNHKTTITDDKDFDIQALNKAVREGNVGVVEAHIMNTNTLLKTEVLEEYLNIASGKGYSQMVSLLLKYSHAIKHLNVTFALLLAIEHGHEEVVYILLSDKRVKPSYANNEALIRACMRGNTTIVRMLLSDRRVDATAQQNKAFHICYAAENWEIFTLLSESIGLFMID